MNDNYKSFNNISLKNPEKDYNKYIWVTEDNIKNINEFNYCSNYKLIKNSSNKNIKDNNLTNKNNNIYKIFNNEEKLSNKEYNIPNRKLTKSKTDNGLIGLSFINQDEKETSNFLDDYCFEDILNDLGDSEYNKNTKNYNIYNIHNNNNKIYFNTPKKYYPNNINNYSKNNSGNIIYKKENIKSSQKKKLKDTIDVLMTQIIPTSNIVDTLTSILKQLGCSDDEIFKLIENKTKNSFN